MDFNLDHPLIELVSSSERSSFTVRHAVEGVQIFGSNGSGKTSGSGRLLALKYLSAQWGGLILTVKKEEKQMWVDFCHLTGRTDDLLIVEPRGKHYFNFLDYESSQTAGDETLTDNVVDLLKTVIRSGQDQGGGKSDDQFWETASDMLIFNVIDLCKLAYGRVTITRMYDILQTIPKSSEGLQTEPGTELKPFHHAIATARDYVNSQIDTWSALLSSDEKERLQDDAVFQTEIVEALPDARLLKYLVQFFVDTFIPLSDKTRGIIDFSLNGFLFRLLRDPVYSLFCRHHSTFKPEDSLDGKIILLNLPVKEYQKVGRDIQILYKYIWQRAMEKRDVRINGRPVFLWADEAQTFIHEKDAEFQATARSSRVATVYISQNLPNYYASMGGQKSEYRVKSFLGTLGTKIFHANADIDTNKYASELIGDAFFEDDSQSFTVSESFSQTRGRSLKLERIVRPEEFVNLRTGGPFNDYRVDGYLHRQGNSIMNGQNHIKMAFNQNYQPQL